MVTRGRAVAQGFSLFDTTADGERQRRLAANRALQKAGLRPRPLVTRLLRGGGFTPASSVVSALELDSRYCVFYWRDAEHGWLHIASRSLVYTWCLRDPDADDGAAGHRASVRLSELEDVWVY